MSSLKNIKFHVTDHPDTCSLYRLELQSLVQAWHLQTAQPNHWAHRNSQQELRNCWDDTARAKESSTPYLWGGLPFRGWIQTHILQDLAVLCATIIITPITDPAHMDIQPGGVVVRTLDLWLRRSWVRLQSCAFRKEPWASCSHTKKYNLVPVKEQWCPAAGKVTVGLVSHCPCNRLQWFIHLWAQGLRKRDGHHAYTAHRVWHTLLTFTIQNHAQTDIHKPIKISWSKRHVQENARSVFK